MTDDRCPNVKIKQHLTTTKNAARTAKPSSWRCGEMLGHEGMCRPRPSAHQSARGWWVTPDGTEFWQKGDFDD